MNSSQHGSRHRCRWATITPLICLLGHLTLSHAATVTYDFNITWVTANPDGMADRPVIGINGAWPLPIIRVDVGDRLIVNVLNSLGNQSTSLHFHGLFQNGTNEMDGPVYVTQCPIPPGSRFTYNFTIDQPGTYWYHSHTHGQYPDGLRAPLIVHDPASPFRDLYDEEVVMSVSDWYHEQMPGLLKWFISKANPTGAEPVPKSALLNETQNLTVPVTPGRTYLFRMVNIGAFAGQYVWFEGHNVTVVEIDGVYTHPTETGMIYLAAAQRYSFLITARDDTEGNFPFVASMDTDMFDTLPDDLNWNVTGWLVYDASKPLPDPAVLPDPSFSPLDDTTLLPWDNQTLLGEPDRIVTLDVAMDNLGDGANYAFFNNITYVSPKIPTLYTVLTTGDNNLNLATDPAVYGTYTSSFVLEKNQIVEVVVNNRDAGKHPFHLHGHHFQTVFRSDEDAGDFISDYYLQNLSATVAPMRRDTVVVRPNGHLVLRFRADNPGVWLFHCHIEWHVASGLVATFIEAPHEIIQQKRTRTLPADHLAACVAAGVPTRGNAAGKDGDDLLDLSGENAPPGPLPAGFTAQGIVGFVFSCVTGLLGVAVVVWYGLAEPPLQDGEEGQGQGQGQQQEVEKGWNGAGETKMGINGDGSDGVVGQMGGDGTGNEVGMGRGVIRAA